MTTQDEALERAFEAYDTLGTYAAFLANLRKSGWTLAPVEATPRMIKAGWAVLEKGRDGRKPILGPGAGLVEAYRAMVDAIGDNG
jgi:hypothetical protein